MNILSVLKTTALCLAVGFAGQTHAGLLGYFSGSIDSISASESAANGDLAADIAADNNAPFNLGTLFTGSFMLDETAIDRDPNPNVGSYLNSLLSFSIAGGDVNKTVSSGRVRITNDEVVGIKFQDTFQVFAMDFDESFVINGNTWIFEMARIELTKRDIGYSSIITDDSLQQYFSDSTPWSWEQAYLKFTLQGVANSEQFARFGSGPPSSNLAVSFLNSPTPSADAPTPATFHLLIAALGLLGLRRHNRAGSSRLSGRRTLKPSR
jgi:hypothetical protein